jgi:hypothetical protein
MAGSEELVDSGGLAAWPAWGVDALSAPFPSFVNGAEAFELMTDGHFHLEEK